MRKTLAIALHTLRAAFRSRLAQILFLLVIASVVILPLTIQGDGTISGYIQVLLSYSLGTAVTLLSITSIWVGCSSISGEIENRRIHMILSKPIHRYQIWLGRWIGLLLLNLLFLTLSGATIYGFMQWRMASQTDQQTDRDRLHTEILLARHQTTPQAENLRTMVDDAIDQKQQQGQIQPGDDINTLRKQLHQAATLRANTLPQGYRKQWTFKLPKKPTSDLPVKLRYRLHSSSGSSGPYRGLWLFNYDKQPGQHDTPALHTASAFHTQTIPPDAIQNDGTLLLDYVNLDPTGDLILFDPTRDLTILSHAGSFQLNYLRVLLIYFTRLLFYSAIGLTMGALFSMPVATFTAIAIIAMQQLSNVLQQRASETLLTLPGQPDPTWIKQLTDTLYRLLNLAIQPLRDTPVLSDLATGILIPWSQVSYAILSKVILYAGLIALTGCLLFNRREIGRPE